MKPLALDAVLALQAEARADRCGQCGVQILDTRDPEVFAAAHLAGSINIGLAGQYATWAGTVLDPAHPIIIIAAPGREHESAIRLGRIGFDQVAGYLENGLRALDSRPDLIAFTEHLSAQSAAERLASDQPPLAIDVRTPREHEQKHIDGSVSIPLNRLADHLQSLPKDRPLLIYCAGGYRSSLAASLLQRADSVPSPRSRAASRHGRRQTCPSPRRFPDVKTQLGARFEQRRTIDSAQIAFCRTFLPLRHPYFVPQPRHLLALAIAALVSPLAHAQTAQQIIQQIVDTERARE